MADLERVLIDTEDFLRRQLGSRTAREAHKQRLKRGVGEAMRRVRRAALLFVLLLLALVLVDVAGASIGFLWLLALPALFMASALSLMWPSRQGRAPSFAIASRQGEPLRLDALVGRCAEALVERCRALPRAALPAADTILARLHDLQPHLAAVPEDSPLVGDARRLIGEHLPRLVDSYLALPPRARGAGSEIDRRFAESLVIVADELTHLCEQLDGCRTSEFETQRRFIETRYGEG